MRILKNIFKKKPSKATSVEENMVYMASLGIPYDKILKYKESVDKIKEWENNNLIK